MTTLGVQKPIIIFYCAVSEDHSLLAELDKHLAVIRRSTQVVTLYTGQILSGAMQEQATTQQFLSADIILLLVSPDALSSSIWYEMMQRAMERHRRGMVCVIPILLRQVYYDDAPFTTLKMLPSDGKAITSHSDPNSIFSEIARSIHTVVKEMQSLPAFVSPSIAHTPTSPKNLPTEILPTEQSTQYALLHHYSFYRWILFASHTAFAAIIPISTQRCCNQVPTGQPATKPAWLLLML